jgi:D-tyrosyl-tRNA(Tyr) deacylase
MRAVVQRVNKASVVVDGGEVGAIGRGFLVLAGFTKTDDDETLRWMARKIVSLRVFDDAEGKMNLGLDAVQGAILVVSQFTLYGDCRKGKRPGFDRSAPPDEAEVLYRRFVGMLREEAPCDIQTGVFQAHMDVSLVNDGPVTLVIEKEAV